MSHKKYAGVFLLAALLMGCSGEQAKEASTGAPPQKSEQTAPDACTVLTAGDVHEALGMAVKVQASDQLKSMAMLSQCSYEAADSAQNVVSVMVRLGAPSVTAEANLKQYVDGLKTNMGADYPIDSVSGLSGPAVWNPDMQQLTVFKGPALAIFTMFDAGSDPLEAAKRLAEKVLPRL